MPGSGVSDQMFPPSLVRFPTPHCHALCELFEFVTNHKFLEIGYILGWSFVMPGSPTGVVQVEPLRFLLTSRGLTAVPMATRRSLVTPTALATSSLDPPMMVNQTVMKSIAAARDRRSMLAPSRTALRMAAI